MLNAANEFGGGELMDKLQEEISWVKYKHKIIFKLRIIKQRYKLMLNMKNENYKLFNLVEYHKSTFTIMWYHRNQFLLNLCLISFVSGS